MDDDVELVVEHGEAARPVLAVGDHDTDGDLDILQRSARRSPVDHLAVADLDGDGLDDLVTLATDERVVTVRPGVTDGFGAANSFLSGGDDLSVIDVDGDGRLDVAAGHWILLGQ